MKRTALTALAAIALLAIGTLFYFKGRRYEVLITQAQINAALAEHFPKSEQYLFVFTITYLNPEITLLPESNRVRVGLDTTVNVKLNKKEEQLRGGVTLTTTISYRSDTQEFFLSDPAFERLEIQGIPKQHLDTVSRFAQEAAAEYLRRFPIYTLKATDARTTAATLLLKKVEVRTSDVVVTLGL